MIPLKVHRFWLDRRQFGIVTLLCFGALMFVLTGCDHVGQMTSQLKDPDPVVREKAALALRKDNDPRAVEPLIAAMTDTDWVVRAHAADALGEIKDLRAVDPLMAAMKDKQRSVRGAAAFALCEIKAPRTYELVNAALKDADDNGRIGMAEPLIPCGDPGIEEALIAALYRSNDQKMANLFINSKHQKLEDAARKWAADHGYQIFCDGCAQQ